MIKNGQSLISNLAPPLAHRRRVLLDVASKTLDSLRPENLLKGSLDGRDTAHFKRIAVFAIGKAAKAMVKGILPELGRKPDMIFIADKGHPLPTKQGLAITQNMIAAARNLDADDLAVVLISGGGSAMFASPAPEITLADKIAVTQELLKCGAPIQEINIVRRHLSQVKGGHFASLLYPATVRGFVISDVVGNDLSAIASGPLSPDRSTFNDARNIVKKYALRLPSRAAKFLENALPERETPKKNSRYFEKVSVQIIADHRSVQECASAAARQHGLIVKTAPSFITGEARDAARGFLQSCAGAGTARTGGNLSALWIAVGETTVTCRGKGKGGRNQEFILSGLKYLKENQTLLSIGTDGIDGMCPEKIAGAIGDTAILDSARAKKLTIEKFLKNNDSYGFFKKAGGLIKTGPTGTNLGDLVMLIS